MNYPPMRMRTLVVALTFLIVIFAVPSAGLGKDTWTRVRSKNFLLVGNANEKDIRNVATKLEQFREVFTHLLTGAKFDSPVPTTVVVFKSKDSYKPFNVGNNAGYFQKGEDVNYITLTTELGAQSPFSVIYHEYVHLLVDNNNGNVPTWFNEGLAEYYSSFNMEEDRKAQLGYLIPYHLLVLRDEKLLPLRTLFTVDRYSPHYNEGGKRGIFYAESWALMHYLILGSNGQHLPHLAKFLQLVSANVPVDDACKQAFEMDIETLEKELKKYIQGHTFKMQVATFERKLEFDSEMKTAPITEAEALGYLGDLLLHINHLDDAEARFQQALALDPKLTMAQASLGILRARRGQFAEAKKHLEDAATGDSNNYLTHYYYAYALSREGMDANNLINDYPQSTAVKIRTELKRAIELNPTFPESYSLLAFVNLVNGDQLDDSIVFLKQALRLSPGRQDFDLMLAQIYLRQEKFILAKQILAALMGAKDRRLQLQAKVLLDSVKNYEEQIASYKAGVADSGGVTGSESPLLRRQGGVSKTESHEDTPPPTPADYLREALRPVEAGEERIQGLFIKLECNNKGIAFFIVQAGDRTHKLRATSLNQIQFTAYTPTAGDVTCGARKTQDNALITFRPVKDPKDIKAGIEGDVIAVEFVPADFRLKE